jgi:hypothetical protein
MKSKLVTELYGSLFLDPNISLEYKLNPIDYLHTSFDRLDFDLHKINESNYHIRSPISFLHQFKINVVDDILLWKKDSSKLSLTFKTYNFLNELALFTNEQKFNCELTSSFDISKQHGLFIDINGNIQYSSFLNSKYISISSHLSSYYDSTKATNISDIMLRSVYSIMQKNFNLFSEQTKRELLNILKIYVSEDIDFNSNDTYLLEIIDMVMI